MQVIRFDDETILELFGADAAEDESPERLKKFFFKNKSYQNITADLPLRILVGHKGIGKSALLRMSHLEDIEQQRLSLWVQPNDLVVEGLEGASFLKRIKDYKERLSYIIWKKSFEEMDLGKHIPESLGSAKKFVFQIKKHALEKVGIDEAREGNALRQAFTKNSQIRVYIDDIDRGWSANKEDIANISALISAARDITNEDRSIQIRIGLRTDAYYLFRTSDESTDKIEGNVVRLEWTNHDILIVMALRISSYFGQQIDIHNIETHPQNRIAEHLHTVIDERFAGRGHWENAPIHRILLSLTRKRPRDLIKLLSGAARAAFRNGNRKITSFDLESTFENYSNERVNDLVLEFRSEVPEIEKLIYNMGPTTVRRKNKEKNYLYTNGELSVKLRNILKNHPIRFNNRKIVTPKSLAEFLYKIDFIIARNDDDLDHIKWTYFDQNRMLQSQFVDFGYKWEVHPAYRWALNPKGVAQILDEIDL